MKFLAKIFRRKQQPSQAPTPAVIRKVTQTSYSASTTAEQMQADYAECDALRKWVRENRGEEAYLHYLAVLDSLRTLTEVKARCEQAEAAEQVALASLDAAYEKRQLVN